MTDILARSIFDECKPVSDSTGNSFASRVQFRYSVPAGKRLVLNESYLSIALEIGVGTAIGGGAIATRPLGTLIDEATPFIGACLSSNPIGCLFNKLTHQINDTPVSEIDLASQTSTLMRLVSESRASNATNGSANPIYVRETLTPIFEAVPGAALVDNIPHAGADPNQAQFNTVVDALNNVSTRVNLMNTTRAIHLRNSLQHKGQVIQANCRSQPVNNLTQFRLNWIPCLGMFNTENSIPSNTKHDLSMYIDSNWFRQIISGSSAADGTSYAVSNTITNPLVAGTIYVSVTDIAMYFSIYDSVEPIPRGVTLNTVEAMTTSQALVGSAPTINFIIPASTFKAVIAFVDSRYGSSTTRSPTDFSLTSIGNGGNAGLSTAFLENFNDISVKYAGAVYPSTPYNFTGGTVVQGTANTIIVPNAQWDVYRAFQEFLVNSDAMADSSGSMFNLQTWAGTPIFVYRLYKPAGDMARELTVKLRLNASVDSVQCVVMALYRKQTSIDYDSNGLVSSVNSAELV